MFYQDIQPRFRDEPPSVAIFLEAITRFQLFVLSCHAVEQLPLALPSSSPSSFASSPNSREAMAMAETKGRCPCCC